MDGSKERQGDFVFTANDAGEYRFCFNNEMSTFAEKMVDFEIAVCDLHHHPSLPSHPQHAAQSIPSALSLSLTTLAPTQVENEARAQIPAKQGSSPEQTSVLEESILKISSQLSTIHRNQKYFRTRENRNFSTVRSTERRIFNFSIIESAMMVTMAGLQVFIVRFFFQGARKGYV
jgi:emp24/gp25L/p24 family/GOLD